MQYFLCFIAVNDKCYETQVSKYLRISCDMIEMSVAHAAGRVIEILAKLSTVIITLVSANFGGSCVLKDLHYESFTYGF